jgi:hypothetical protein
MKFRIALENNVEGRSLAWVLEHPGCFAYGATPDLALSATPEAIFNYVDWINNRSALTDRLELDDIELALDETWDVYGIDEQFDLAVDGYEVNAWFRYDWKPLTQAEIERGLQILDWTRLDLLDTATSLTPDILIKTRPGERWNIEGILKHIGGAEWWYLDRLGLAFPKSDIPKDPFSRLEKVRQRLIEALPDLVGSKQVLGIDGEFWSPRKLLRRTAWHERDHSDHIRKLLTETG